MKTQTLVLGAGPGGYTAAFRAADLGQEVVLVERYPILGGVCLNVGCIPSKALLHVAKVIDEAAHFAENGVGFGQPELDLGKILKWKESVVGKLTKGLEGLAKRRNVKVVQGTGRFTGPHELVAKGDDGETTITFDHAIVAVGSRAVKLPGIPWDDPRVMDSTDALELAEIPEKLLVIGGGIIGLEMATVYSALGSAITVVELLDGLIPGADRDLVKPLHKRLEKRYAGIHLKTKVAGLAAKENGLEVRFEGAGDVADAPAPATFDRVLVAVGRRPNGKDIGADAAGVHVDDRGFLPVDRQLRTNVPHVFAVGDVVGNPMLAHKAMHEAKVAAEVIAGHNVAFDARVIPSVAYTDPEVAWVGVTGPDVEDRKVDVGKFPWSASGRSLSLGRDEGLTKLWFDGETGRLIGGGLVGPSAGDLVAEIALGIEMGCDAEDLGLVVHPHPTLSETVMNSAEAVVGSLTELYLRRASRA